VNSLAVSNIIGEEESEEIFAEINITPLTDIFLVLLIIFMVTTTTLVMQGTSVNLPESAASSDQPSGVLITFTENNEIMVDDKVVRFEDLRHAVSNALAGTKEKIAVLRADKTVNLGQVVKVMSEAQLSGAQRLAILTQPEKKDKKSR
jgi:biopolymer transport protein ExbD